MEKSLRKRKREEENEEVQRKMFHSNESKKPDFTYKSKRKNKDDDGNSSSSSSSGDSNASGSNKSSDSEEESLADKFRRGGNLPSDLDTGSSDDSGDSANSGNENDDGDDGDWNMMGAALEREFLGMDENWGRIACRADSSVREQITHSPNFIMRNWFLKTQTQSSFELISIYWIHYIYYRFSFCIKKIMY